MKTLENDTNSKAPFVDFSLQFSLANYEKVENCIFDILKSIATDIAEVRSTMMGAIVVLSDFSKSHRHVEGLVQMKPKKNPIETLITVDTEEGAETIINYSRAPYDGAIVVDRTGQIIGAGVYLVVDHPDLDLPEGCGTRHKAAASFSLRNDVISVLTLSEETNTIRLWKDGSPKEILEVKSSRR